MSRGQKKQPAASLFPWYLRFVVFCCGAVVMVLELIGSRILSPYFGSGLQVWSALIGVTLGALAIGYTLGGRLADRRHRVSDLSWLVAAAAALLLPAVFLRSLLLPLLSGTGLGWGALLSALLLLAPSLLLLGAIPPYAIRLHASKLQVVGRSAGGLYALSTVGSLLGTLGAGYWIIPSYGVNGTLAAVLAVLLAAAIAGLAIDPRRMGLVLLPAACLASLLLPSPQAPAGEGEWKLLARKESPYGSLVVLEQGEVRSLLIDGISHIERTGR